MKVLWFTNTPSLYDQGKHHYHGCGWIESLEELLSTEESIELGVSFFHGSDSEKVIKNQTTYYPIIKSSTKNPLIKLVNNWNGEIEFPNIKKKINEIINDFKPDVIQVFGTEGSFSQVQELTNIPVIYHIQGLINPCLNAYFPPNQSTLHFHLSINYLIKTIKGNNPAFDFKRFKNQALRERDVLRNVKYVMGRTDWDKMIVELYNPKVQYFHVDEILRSAFYIKKPILNKLSKQLKIVSTLSPTIYKGIDVVLRTAKKLQELTNIEYSWEIIGIEENSILLKHFEKSEGVRHQDVNIICRGRKSAEEIIEIFDSADVYVHPSYIDNSPNSICEAQMSELPVIACKVGGVETLVEHTINGILVPANGVFEIIHAIKELNENTESRTLLGRNAREAAKERHNTEKIIADLINVYRKVQNIKS